MPALNVEYSGETTVFGEELVLAIAANQLTWEQIAKRSDFVEPSP